jgi:hypothetical protein
MTQREQLEAVIHEMHDISLGLHNTNAIRSRQLAALALKTERLLASWQAPAPAPPTDAPQATMMYTAEEAKGSDWEQPPVAAPAPFPRIVTWREVAQAIEKHKPDVAKRFSLAELTYIAKDLSGPVPPDAPPQEG